MAALIAWMPVVRVDDLVKDRRPPEAAALRAVLDKIINTSRNAVQAIKAAFWASHNGLVSRWQPDHAATTLASSSAACGVSDIRAPSSGSRGKSAHCSAL